MITVAGAAGVMGAVSARRLENMPIACDYANNFRQDLQDGLDLNVIL